MPWPTRVRLPVPLLLWLTLSLLLCGVGALTMAHAQPYTSQWDTIPDFAPTPTHISARDGAWADPATWQGEQVPTDGAIVRISSHTVTVSTGSAAVLSITAGGTAQLVSPVDLRVGTLVITQGATLVGGSAENPLTGTLTIRDIPLNPQTDPQQFGTGILVLEGTVRLHGAAKTPFVRVTDHLAAKQAAITLVSAPSGWAAGDRVVIPDSRQRTEAQLKLPLQLEERTLAGITEATLQLDTPLTYAHPGTKSEAPVHPEFYPHVLNLSRSFVVRSENPVGTRGHVFVTGASTFEVHYVAWQDVGRTTMAEISATNLIGRYMLHMHHLRKAPILVGNVIYSTVDHPAKWGLALHDTQNALVQGNIAYNIKGAGFAVEEQEAILNTIDGNFALNIMGDPNCTRGDNCRPGRDGVGFYHVGTNNRMTNNVVANSRQYGYLYFGGDTFLEFDRNEVYGMRSGMSMWYINGACTNNPRYNAPMSYIRNLHVWHVYENGMGQGYPSFNVQFERMVLRGDPKLLGKIGFLWLDYRLQNGAIRDSEITGFRYGVEIPRHHDGLFRVENTLLRNYTNVLMETVASPGSNCSTPMKERHALVDNVQFQQLTSGATFKDNAGKVIPQTNITLSFTPMDGGAQILQPGTMKVKNYNQQAGRDFQVYFLEQAPEFVIPAGGKDVKTHPQAGMTNAAAWAKDGVAISGAVAPCTTTEPLIRGFVCVAAGELPPPCVPSCDPARPCNVAAPDGCNSLCPVMPCPCVATCPADIPCGAKVANSCGVADACEGPTCPPPPAPPCTLAGELAQTLRQALTSCPQ